MFHNSSYANDSSVISFSEAHSLVDFLERFMGTIFLKSLHHNSLYMAFMPEVQLS